MPERTEGVAIVERRVALEVRAFDQRQAIIVRGVVARGIRQPVFIEIAAIDGQVAASATEVETIAAGNLVAVEAGAVGGAPVAFEEAALHVALEDGVDHARHRVRAIDRRRAVTQHFEPLDAARRDFIGVGAHHRHEQFGLETGVKRHPAAIDQQQRVAGAEVAQVDRADVAADIVDGRRILFVERDGAGLGIARNSSSPDDAPVFSIAVSSSTVTGRTSLIFAP